MIEIDLDKCTVIKSGQLQKLCRGMPYCIYQHQNGEIYCKAVRARFLLAESLEELEKMSEEQLERKIYSFEMAAFR